MQEGDEKFSEDISHKVLKQKKKHFKKSFNKQENTLKAIFILSLYMLLHLLFITNSCTY